MASPAASMSASQAPEAICAIPPQIAEDASKNKNFTCAAARNLMIVLEMLMSRKGGL